MKIVFFGSPDFAVTALRALVEAGVAVVGVVTQPDKPAGRGNQLRAPAVKTYAESVGLEVYQPTKVRDGTLAAWVRARQPDLAVVAAYGRILTQEVLDAPRLGCVNVHASLLPRWRGASPIARAIAARDSVAGACLMQMDAGLDTGAVLDRVEVAIERDDTTPTLEAKIAAAGAGLLVARLADLSAGRLSATAQPEQGVTWAPPIEKSEGRLDFARDAADLHAQVRAMQPWPGGFFASAAAPGEDWKVFAEGLQVAADAGRAGTLVHLDRTGIRVACGHGSLTVHWLQRPGKARVAAADVVRGCRLGLGDALWSPA